MNLAYLDGVRGYMALWVLASHLIQRSQGPNIFLVKGGIAVDVFMLVSGILMAHNVLARARVEPLDRLSTWRKFFIRRFFRIAPLYYLLLVFSLVFVSNYDEWVRVVDGKGYVFPGWLDFWAHISFVYGLFPQMSSTNVLPDWSLSLEMQFYLLFPLLLVFMRRNWLAFSIFCMVVYWLAGQYVGVYNGLPGQLIVYPQPSFLPLKVTCFAAGMLCVYIGRRQDLLLRGGGLFLALIVFNQRPTFSVIALFIFIVYYFSVVEKSEGSMSRWGVMLAGFANRWLGGRCAKFLGDISYGLYLSHFLILFPLVAYGKQHGWFDGIGHWARLGLATVLVLPPVLLLSWLLHVFVERPFINIGRSLVKR